MAATVNPFEGLSYGELHGLYAIQIAKIEAATKKLQELLVKHNAGDFSSAMAAHADPLSEDKEFLRGRDSLMQEIKVAVKTADALSTAQEKY